MTLPLTRLSISVLAALTLGACSVPNAETRTSHAATPVVQAAAATPQMVRQSPAPGLYEIVYSPKRNAVYVSAAGGRGPDAPAPRVLQLDPQTLAVVAEIPLERRGYGLALDDAAGRLYVGNTSDASITVIDLERGAVTDVVQLAEKFTDAQGRTRYPHSFRQLVLDPDQHRLYTPGLSMEESALYVVDTRTLQVVGKVPGLGFLATGATLDAPRHELHVTTLAGKVHTIDTRTLAIKRSTQTGGDQLLNVTADANGERLFITDQGLERVAGLWKQFAPDYQPKGAGNQVLVLQARDGAPLAQLATDAGPVAVLLDDQRQRLYVTNRGGGSITVYDSNSYAPLATLPLPSHPNSLALDSANNVLYATIKNGDADPKDGNESVVRLAF